MTGISLRPIDVHERRRPSRTARCLGVLVAGLALAATLTPAAAAETSQYTLRGLTATTSFSTTDGCVETRALTTAVDGTIRSGRNGSVSASTLYLYVAQIDWCTGDYLVSAYGVIDLPASAFRIDRRLTTATLDATGTVFDFVSQTERVARARVTWTSAGVSDRRRSHTRTVYEGFTATTRLDETFREARASGSVTDGTTEFAPAAGYGAALSSVRTGTVTIVR